MKKIIIYIFLFTLVLNQHVFSQSEYILEEYSPYLKTVIYSSSIVYYGVDMSMVKLTNPMKLYQDNAIRHYLYAWIATFEKEVPPEKYIAKWLKKQGGFRFEPDNVQKRVQS